VLQPLQSLGCGTRKTSKKQVFKKQANKQGEKTGQKSVKFVVLLWITLFFSFGL